MAKCVLGIIGGSGIYDLPGLTNMREEKVATPWGDPSAPILTGEIAGLPVVFLPRHDKGHRLSPSDINYRANIDALKRMGVTDLISLSACGSFKQELPPGTFVLVDQFVDRTYKRESSFFGRGLVAHVSMAHPVSPRLRIHLAAAAAAEGIDVVRDGTYVCIEGPQFSTLAEAHLHRQLRFEVIGMTNVTEAKLAREAELCYATIAMITDYDCWHPEHESVSVTQIIATLNQNAENAQKVLREAVRAMPTERGCKCGAALKHALITDLNLVPPATKKRLASIIGKYLS
jgi:5'-methylthioadenosine phosphorylase